MVEFNGFVNYNGESVQNLICETQKLNDSSSKEQWMKVISKFCEGGQIEYGWYVAGGQELSYFPSKIWTLAHHAALYNAPLKSVEILLKRCRQLVYLVDGEGKLPLDHLANRSVERVKLFTPVYTINFNKENLLKIERQFHSVILERVKDLIKKNYVVLPVISLLLMYGCDEDMWFAVPGMYGGFKFNFEINEGEITALTSSSWCRVVGGSGQEHRCTPKMSVLVSEGYV